MKLGPFWCYYGGKFRLANRYPQPRFDVIIEPFAGAAGYSMHYADRQVVLIDKYPVIVEIWHYLIRTPSSEILNLPLTDSVDDLPSWVPEGARHLIGFCLNDAGAAPARNLSAGVRRLREGKVLDGRPRKMKGWSFDRRERTARQVALIKHWQVFEEDYVDLPNVEATWYVDPPYYEAGIHYKHSSRNIDYKHLASWCRERLGQTIVCENEGATWLPFQFLIDAHAAPTTHGQQKRTSEVVWVGGM